MNTTNEFRLTDELERALLREAMVTPREVELLPALKSGLAAIGRAFDSVFAFIGNLNDAMNQARARSATYSGSQW
ncbi:MAG TPA: hypothetical protein VGC69_10820 [Bordetella sp.]